MGKHGIIIGMKISYMKIFNKHGYEMAHELQGMKMYTI